MEAYYHWWVWVGNDGGVDGNVDCDGKIWCNGGGSTVSNIGYEEAHSARVIRISNKWRWQLTSAYRRNT